MSDRERKLKDRASKLYAEGKLKDALKIYEEIVAQDPSELQCQIKIGDIYRKLGERASAVAAYEPVANAYAEDGMLLKAIAVCKLILGVDPRHTATQEMLATLYSKRKVPERMPLPPRPMPAPHHKSKAIELPEVDGEPEVFRSLSDLEPKIIRGKPAEELVEAVVEAEPQQARPALQAPMMAWPVSAATTPPPEPPIEDSALDITVSEMEDEPLELEHEEEVIELVQPKPAPIDETWSGVIRLADVDQQELLEVKRAVEEVAETLAVDDAPTDVREAPPIELTQRITESTGDLAEELDRPQIPLFSDLPKSAFIELLVQMDMKEMTTGERVITEGEVGDSFFVVATGKVRVARKSDTGEEVTLAYLTDGAFFGEMALLSDGARTASVIVEEESQIFEISKDVLDRVVSAFPSVASVLKNFYRQRLLSTVMATHPLVRPFDAEQRRGLMEMFKSKPFKKGDVLLRQGKKGAGLFLLLNGKLRVTTEKAEGGGVELAELGPGDLFGEMSLLTNQPTTASVTALSDCFVLRLSKKNFDEVIMTHPQILELVAQVSEERKSFNELLLSNPPMIPTSGAILV